MELEEGIQNWQTTGEKKPLPRYSKFVDSFFTVFMVVLAILFFFSLFTLLFDKTPVPKIELASMDFTVLNITDTRLSAKWDLSILIPESIPGRYICFQGDLKASFLYKNVTLATSSPQKYYGLMYNVPQLLRVSANVSGEDIDGLIGKDIMDDMKKREVRFGSRFFLTDCREKTTGTMSYACDEVTLRFEPGSEMKAALFGKNPNCVNF